MLSLKYQTISSVKWTTTKTVIVASTLPLLQIVQAWFLSPEEFAYIAIILIFTGFFETLENFGISQAIIQKDSIDNEEASSLFFFNIFLGILLAITLFFLSKPASLFFSLPKLDYYLKLTSSIIIIGSPANLFKAVMQKHLYFKTLAIIELVKHLTVLTLVILLLYFGFGVLGFIYAYLISSVLFTCLIIFQCLNHRIVKIILFFSFKKIFPFLSFGVYVSGKEIMTYCAHRLDELVIGYFLAPEVLGIYSFGKRTLEKIRKLITQSFGRVLFAVFSNLNDNLEKISSAYLKVTKYIGFVSFPVFAGIMVTAHLFVPIVFGEKWLDSIIIFQVFPLAMLFIVLTASVATSLLYSLNRPDIVFYIDIATNSIYFCILYIFSHRGILAVLIIYSLYAVCKSIALQYYANKKLRHSFTVYLKQLLGVFIITVVMVAGVFIFQLLSEQFLTNTLQLSGSIAFGGLLFLVLSLIFQKNTFDELISIFIKKQSLTLFQQFPNLRLLKNNKL